MTPATGGGTSDISCAKRWLFAINIFFSRTHVCVAEIKGRRSIKMTYLRSAAAQKYRKGGEQHAANRTYIRGDENHAAPMSWSSGSIEVCQPRRMP